MEDTLVVFLAIVLAILFKKQWSSYQSPEDRAVLLLKITKFLKVRGFSRLAWSFRSILKIFASPIGGGG
ncbi:MAG: hypothetical protein ACXACY_31200 [Candidatus Hodarchaeales archaeon]|jgi:hypothetical protein